MRSLSRAFFLATWVAIFGSGPALAEPLKRSEAVAIARSYAEHSWVATEKNVLHGRDASKIEVHTPNQQGAESGDGLWTPGKNLGVPYKWGGFDSLEKFDTGVRAGKAAGDLYSAEKRQLGGAAVSGQAVGVDCSGFISRCWKLSEKHGTATLPDLCTKLASAAELRPGDILNTSDGHVILFAKWLDETKTRALFYEAHPFSKVRASEYDAPALVAQGFKPYRYRKIQD